MDQDQSRQRFFHSEGWAWSPSVRPATKAGAQNGSTLAGIPPTSGEATPQRRLPRLPVLQRRSPSCLNVTMRVHFAVDDARSLQLSLATGKRWEGSVVSDQRQSKTQTRSHSGMPLLSGLTGRPRHAKKEGSGHPKGHTRINLHLFFLIGVEARSPSMK